jgi:mono/diheme cytochrome c family protein
VIGTVAFILIFVVLGLSVVLAAMRSGRGAGAPKPPGRGQRRATALGIGAVIVAVGLAVPGLVLAFNAHDHARQGPSGVDLSSGEAKGRELFTQNCATCHTLAASHAVGRVGPNLDTLNGGDLKPAFILDAIKNGRSRGNGQMPVGLLLGEDAENVANYVSAVAGR